MTVETLKVGYFIVALLALALVLTNLVFIRQWSWYRLLVALTICVMYICFSIWLGYNLNVTFLVMIGLIFCEEFVKFVACRMLPMAKWPSRMSIGAIFGLSEVILAKSQTLIIHIADNHTFIVFSLFSIIAVSMHTVTPLYFNSTKNTWFNVTIGFGIHLFSNHIALQADDRNWALIAVIQISFLFLAAIIFFKSRKRLDLFNGGKL